MCRRLSWWLALLFVHAASGSLVAHPVPRDNHDRIIVVKLTPEGVIVDYRLEMDEFTAALDLLKVARGLAPEDVAHINDRKKIPEVFLRFHAPYFRDNLVASLDGRDLKFEIVRTSFKLIDHLRCDVRFRADWKLDEGREHRFAFREANYEIDEVSKLEIRLTAGKGVEIVSADAPDEALMAQPSDLRGPGDTDRLRTVRAVVSPIERDPAGVFKLALPPDPGPDRSLPEGQGAEAKGAGGAEAGWAKEAVVQGSSASWDKNQLALAHDSPFGDEGDEAGASQPPEPRLIDLLFDTRSGLIVLLLLAGGFGAAHALTPGHGKAMVAAYLVGERGKVRHALVLGLVITLSHTFAVLILAAVLYVFFRDASPEKVHRGVSLLGGLLITAVGMWLLMRRLAGQADHIHIGGGGHHHHHHHHGHSHDHAHDHHHDHSHDHDHSHPPGGVSWWATITLGIGGGIVPCWDALLLVSVAALKGKLELALPLVIAFSAGLALILIALGISVVLARNYAERRWGESGRWRGVARVLPILSSILILAMGLWLCYESSHGR